LTANIELLKLIAQHLLDIETLTKEDIYEIVDTGKLGWWEKKKAKESKKALEMKAVEPVKQKEIKPQDERVLN
jgi:cell division protease FtsH